MQLLRITGARQHNLKNLSLDLPRHQLIVITGVSGSGKSSLAFDTLYAEGQRRYVESLSVYARQFLDRLEKPDVDSIEGLSPAIAIEQRTTAGSPRSTIATTSEIYDFFRILFTHLGIAHHPTTGKPLQRLTTQELADRALALPEGTALQLLAPVVTRQKGEFRDVLDKLRRDGFIRARVDGTVVEIEHLTGLDRHKSHTIEAVIDRLKIKEGVRSRLTDSLETALRTGNGVVRFLATHGDGREEEWLGSNQNFDPETGYHFGELTPRHFSFNAPQGACPTCHGLGTQLIFDADLLVSDPAKTLAEMPIDPWQRANAGLAAVYRRNLGALAQHYGVSLETPWRDTPEEFRRNLIYGTGETAIAFPRGGELAAQMRPWAGILQQLRDLYDETKSELTRQRLQRFMSKQPCPACHGARLKPETLAVTITASGHKPVNIHQLCQMTIDQASAWSQALQLTSRQEAILREPLREVRSRLQFLQQVGLGYLTLNRESGSLSGGEAQRIRLATHLGSRLTGVLYILDEPSIGLHQRDNDRLLEVLRALRDLGNTLIVVEHDEDTMLAADYLVELGPAAGPRGGYLVAAGPREEFLRQPHSLTARYLTGQERVAVPKARQAAVNGFLTVRGAKAHNLRNLDVPFPLGLFTCVTGVSGSGKSTLVNGILSHALFRHFYNAKTRPGEHRCIEGLDLVDKAIVIDQSPIGRTPRSNPLSYVGAYNPIRDLFAQLPSSRVRGYGAGRFSFNVEGGRCEHCEGAGVLAIEMSFLPPVYVTCEHCGGKRFNRETLEITYKGRNIADVLEMTVDEALTFFRSVPNVVDKLHALASVGLGYLKLGQQATSLSGGEAQRIKLAAELAKKQTGRTVYLLDEPTTGLHWADIELLLRVLYQLRDAGNTLIVIEHNLHVIKCADHLIDLGPEGGTQGGCLVATGTPEELARHPTSHTGRYLARVLGGRVNGIS